VSQELIGATPFAGLTPEVVLAAVESLGLPADGRLMALNSYENRVYRVGLEPGALQPRVPQVLPSGVVAKFYREGRWTDAQLAEEHQFARELAGAQLPVASPLVAAGATLHRHQGFRFAVFECWRGGAPDLDLPGHRALLGRTLGRLHAIGGLRPFTARGNLRDWRMGQRARDQILQGGHAPAQHAGRYAEAASRLIDATTRQFAACGATRELRLHGDCHAGNILWNEQGPLFVDFDDCIGGPAVQDLWMHCAGSPAQMQAEWSQLLEGYEQFAHFDFAEAGLIEALRALRMLNHAAWLARRWSDPAFPRAFPWFGEARYWERHIDELHEQCEAVEDPPLLRAL
jgi:Ser/Thr protein kinase RdoA (MazF antagonist)